MRFAYRKGRYYMIDFIKKSINLRKKELLTFPAIVFAGFALGHLILWLVMTLDKSEDLTSFESGTIIALIILLFCPVFCGFFYSNNFNYALSMSQKRKNIITAQTVISTIRAASSVLLIFLLNLIESNVCTSIFSEYPMESNFSVIFKPHIMFIMILAYVAIETLFGTLYTRLGNKYIWAAWLIFVLLMQLPRKLSSIIDVRHLFTVLDRRLIFSIITIILLLLIALPYVILRKQRVTI